MVYCKILFSHCPKSCVAEFLSRRPIDDIDGAGEAKGDHRKGSGVDGREAQIFAKSAEGVAKEAIRRCSGAVQAAGRGNV